MATTPCSVTNYLILLGRSPLVASHRLCLRCPFWCVRAATQVVSELLTTAPLSLNKVWSVPFFSSFVATTTLTGTTGNDILNAPGSVSAEVVGLAGNDTITLALGGDAATAGAGNDSIAVNITGGASGAIYAGEGDDSVTFGTGVDNVSGTKNLGAGDDIITSDDLVVNATLQGNTGADTVTLTGAVSNTFSSAKALTRSRSLPPSPPLPRWWGVNTLNITGPLSSSTIQASMVMTALSVLLRRRQHRRSSVGGGVLTTSPSLQEPPRPSLVVVLVTASISQVLSTRLYHLR